MHSLNGKLKVIAKYDYDKIGRLKTKQFSPSDAIGSNQSGLWTQTGTWQGGSLPTISDQVTINTGHTVTIPNGQTVQAGTLFNQGILQNFGVLQMGTLAGNVAETLQSVDYSYHIRGGLRGINLDASGNLTNKLFSMKLEYEDDGNYFDGNISRQYWKSNLDGKQRAYAYNYDGASRIKSGTYASTQAGENYSLNNVDYDFNGNITALSRNGLKSNNTFGLIDNLNYTYQANSNKIQAVADNSGETASFTDVVGSTDYTYHPDGSLKSDANKGITLIEYNYLKLPKRIVKGSTTILYQYDASGKKLKEIIGTQVTDYVGNLIYKNGVLYQLGHDEGRIINGEYEYNIKDHLGNLRVAFRDSSGIAKVVQANSYGVWGEDLTTLRYLKPLWKEDKFRQTGKEFLPETGYTDFGARLYDNLVPRFMTIDPMAEKYFDLSGYNYVANNPIRFIDPEGLDIWINYGDGQRARYENGKVYNEDGSKYKGKDSFVGTIVKNLDKMSSTEIGKSVLGSLSDSKSDYSFVNSNPKTSDGKEVQGLSFQALENGGGTIQAGFLMSNLSKQTSQEGSNIESTAHELFHAYQSENGERGASVNKEVGAYLFGKAVSTNLGYGFSGFGNLSKEGQNYDKSMTDLMFSDKFNQKLYDTSINAFKTGSTGNNGTSGGIYNKFKIVPNDKNPVIKRLYPLIK